VLNKEAAMELQEFVQRTIEQIIAGIKASHQVVTENGGRIDTNSFQKIEFDVAVTTSEDKEKKGGAGILVWGIGLGAQAKVETNNSCVSRVQFTVPFAVPKSGR
jgi:hypothetical protein